MTEEKVKKKRFREKIGMVFRINLHENDMYAYGQVTTDKYYVFFDHYDIKDQWTPIEEIIKKPIIFNAIVFNWVLKDGIWEVLGVWPVKEEHKTFPKRFRYYGGSYILTDGGEYWLNGEKCSREKTFGHEPDIIVENTMTEQRLRDHFANRPCYFTEKYRWQHFPPPHPRPKEFYAQYDYDFHWFDDIKPIEIKPRKFKPNKSGKLIQGQIEHKTGIVFRIKLTDEKLAYGQAVNEEVCIFFNHFDDINQPYTPLDEIMRKPLLFYVRGMGVVNCGGDWELLKRLPVSEEHQNLPEFFHFDILKNQYYICHPDKKAYCSPEDLKGRYSYQPMSEPMIESRLRPYMLGLPSYYEYYVRNCHQETMTTDEFYKQHGVKMDEDTYSILRTGKKLKKPQ